MPKETCCQKFMLEFLRWVFAPLVFVPLACLCAPFYRLLDKFKFEWFQQRRVSSPSEHRLKVARVQEQVKGWSSSGRKARMCTAKPAWNSLSMRWIDKRNLIRIQIDHLNSVVEVDETNRTVTVEPGVLMGHLTSILIPRGWTIPVVPEFETLSVGGVICGTGVETSSTRVGLSADTALAYEVVLSNGSVVTCSEEENTDLFRSIPWSHGTLGLLTAVKFPLIPAKKYVALEYHAIDSPAEAFRLLENQDHEFVEGLAYGPRAFVVMYGDMADGADLRRGRVNHINSWYKPMFYKHAESFLPRGRDRGAKPPARPHVDYIPLRDYYHRHTRAYFWAAEDPMPYLTNRLFLFLFGWILPCTDVKLFKRVIFAMMPARMTKRVMDLVLMNTMLQDFLVPLRHLEEWIRVLHETVEVYPLWICPTKFFKKPGMATLRQDSKTETELFMDIGVYGPTRKKKTFNNKETIRKLEAFTMEQGGFQFMYADSFLSREEFRRMFDMTLYDAVREKYDAVDAFPDVYDKVSKHARGLEV